MKVGRTPLILPPRYPAEALAEPTAWLEEQRRLWEEILDRLVEHVAAYTEERRDDRNREQD
jgi:hypothetical protein